MAGLLEVCCFSIEDARIAQDAGADRIELCAGRPEGGTTPSIGVLEQARQVITIPVFPMVRPRGGSFDYGPNEFAAMRRDVGVVAELGFPGVVFGVLGSTGHLDRSRTSRLIGQAVAANPAIEITFHRAFDEVVDPVRTYRELAELGVSRILTSGQKPTAAEGLALIAELIALPERGPLVMPGGGVRPDNVESFLLAGATNVHSSATAAATDRVDPGIVARLADIVHV